MGQPLFTFLFIRCFILHGNGLVLWIKTTFYEIFKERWGISENEMTNYQLYIYLIMFCTFHAQKLCIFSCLVTYCHLEIV